MPDLQVLIHDADAFLLGDCEWHECTGEIKIIEYENLSKDYTEFWIKFDSIDGSITVPFNSIQGVK